MTDKGHLVSPDSVFDDGKAPDALRTIGEVARLLGVKPHVLRYWEEQFPMLRPLTRAGNRRYYRAEDVALVATIDRLLNREGYTIRGARQALEGGLCPSMPTSTVAPAPAPVAVADQPAAASEPALETELVAAVARLRVHLEQIRSGLSAALDEE
ncbi:MerR family transcriptional regulator [Novosphingobium pokkalii]|uniref:MerR family transcriptional regulator n=1 Tax=Novosphingobium pokkalii TaxID=1770194 RepID=A0ABV7VCI2_9SPHN|nr:MerR family transcriptional regulator [Novosphingobium pokkalii]GHC95045.1 hypothetical protein GCM10019060_23640 [Novosphingobium pokkalii]